MEEVIAKKANLLPGYIVLEVFAAAFIAFGIFAGVGLEDSEGMMVIAIAVGAIFALFATIMIVKFVKTPANLRTYCDGKFTFPKGVTCEPQEITHVLLKLTRTQYGVVQSTGGMVITVRGEKIKINNIAHVKDAEERLSQICNAAKQEAMQAALQAQAQQQPQSEAPEKDDDPFNL